MKFIQQAHTNPSTQFVYRESQEAKENKEQPVTGAENAEELAQLGTSAELGNLSVQAITEAYWKNNNRANVLTSVNDSMGYKRGSGNRIKSFNTAVKLLGKNDALKDAFANALGLTSNSTEEENSLAKKRPVERPADLVPKKPKDTPNEAAETTTAQNEAKPATKATEEKPTEVVIDNTPEGRAEALINAMEANDYGEAKITGVGLLGALKSLGLNPKQRRSVNLLLSKEFDTNKFLAGDTIALNKPKNGSLEIKITRNGKEHGTFTYPEVAGSAIQLGSKIEIAAK